MLTNHPFFNSNTREVIINEPGNQRFC